MFDKFTSIEVMDELHDAFADVRYHAFVVHLLFEERLTPTFFPGVSPSEIDGFLLVAFSRLHESLDLLGRSLMSDRFLSPGL